jgi:hypothetical protein
MNQIPVPHGFKVSVEIRREDGTAFVDVIAPFYAVKKWTMPHLYHAARFTDEQIIKDSDFVRVMFSHYPADN